MRAGTDTGETTPSVDLSLEWLGDSTPKAVETREASSLPTLCGGQCAVRGEGCAVRGEGPVVSGE